MTSLNPTDQPLESIEADAIILGVTADGEIAAHSQLSDTTRSALTQQANALEASHDVGTVTVLPGDHVVARRVVLTGIGEGTDAQLREAAGAASRACGKEPATVAVGLPVTTPSAQGAVAEGAVLGAYTFTDYKALADGEEPYRGADWLIAGASDNTIADAKVVIAAVAGARDLINTAPLDLYPDTFADATQEFASQVGVEFETWDPPRLAAEGFGGLLAVGMGSARLPRLVRVSHKPEGATMHVALVGKGITFDSGGLSLKPPASMETMKSDMSGAAAVLHVVLAAARDKLPVAVTGWLCLAENLPSGTAQRPSDVIRIYGGTSVEVLNTDAEGRLVLADGLVRAQEDKPDVLIDVATLTGAQGAALGERTSGVMGSEEIRTAIVAAADAVAEPMWPMPLPNYLTESLKSKVADLKNIGDRANAGMLTAGLFLKEFVHDDTAWAHLDIARPAFNEGKPHGFTPAGGTGAAVRTLIRYLRDLSA